MSASRPHFSRRELMQWFAAATTLAACGEGKGAICGTPADEVCAADATVDPGWASPALDIDPFQLGIASGDPLSDRVVLWTRLVGDGASTPLPDSDVAVAWDLAMDEGFQDLVASGTAPAVAQFGHSVHVDASCLDPDTTYYYRFRLGEWTSPVGRTRTLPCADESPESMAFAVACCQHFEAGYYTPHDHLAEEPNLSVVFFLGDYIYESDVYGGVRSHDTVEPTDLDGYRARYEQYKRDPSLQAAHAAHPWMLIWDDHEVDNNYAGDVPAVGEVDAFVARRAAAYQAFYEHHAIRVAPPESDALAIHRALQFGDLARFSLLDTRQYRDDQACGDTIGVPCDEIQEADRTLLGKSQRDWLLDNLATSDARWNLIVSQVVMSETTLNGAFINPDQWDGYPVERQTIVDTIRDHNVSNVVVLSGDVHIGAVGYVTERATDGGTAPVATEIVCASITSAMFSSARVPAGVGVLIENLPNVEHFDLSALGYVRVDLTPDTMDVQFRTVDTVEVPTASIGTQSQWRIDAGSPVARRM